MSNDNKRKLTDAEIRLLEHEFGVGRVDWKSVTVRSTADNRSYTADNTINLESGDVSAQPGARTDCPRRVLRIAA
jgi:hypothetical protein